MAVFRLDISTDNDAFHGDDLPQELADIIGRLAINLRAGEYRLQHGEIIRLRDRNGARVGFAEFREDVDPLRD